MSRDTAVLKASKSQQDALKQVLAAQDRQCARAFDLDAMTGAAYLAVALTAEQAAQRHLSEMKQARSTP